MSLADELRLAMERDEAEEQGRDASEDLGGLRKLRNATPVDKRWRHVNGPLPTDF